MIFLSLNTHYFKKYLIVSKFLYIHAILELYNIFIFFTLIFNRTRLSTFDFQIAPYTKNFLNEYKHLFHEFSR